MNRIQIIVFLTSWPIFQEYIKDKYIKKIKGLILWQRKLVSLTSTFFFAESSLSEETKKLIVLLGHKRISSRGLLIKRNTVVAAFEVEALLLYFTLVKQC